MEEIREGDSCGMKIFIHYEEDSYLPTAEVARRFLSTSALSCF